jgi:hypothetical protein
MTAWTDLVKKIYNENKHKDGYKLGMAMKSAKKVYKTMKTTTKGVGKFANKKNKTGKRKVGGTCMVDPLTHKTTCM